MNNESSDQPNVSIVILTWNNFQDTSECIQSIQKINYGQCEIIVVDNGSTDGSYERLNNEYPDCSFIQNEENLGFAAGNNRGIKYALESGTDYVVLLNNDTVAKQDFLTPLISTMESESDVGAAACVVHNNNGDLWYSGGEINTLTIKSNKYDSVKSDNAYETGFITGAAIAVPANVFYSIGLLDESYFFGIEDLEYSHRLQQANLRLLVVPSSRICHKVGMSSGNRNAFAYYHATRGRLHFASSELPLGSAVLFYIFFAITRLYRAFEWILTGKSAIIWATIRAILDHLFSEKTGSQDSRL